MGAVIVALGACAVGFTQFKRYVAEDPGFCAHCHKTSPEFSAWTKGQHRGTACQSCHHGSSEQGLAMLRAFIVDGSTSKPRKHAEVEVGSCAACHLSHDPRWKQIGESRGHRVHVEQHKIACVTCHATSVHGFEPASASCVSCHGKHLVGVTGMEKLHCFACHEFLTTEPGLRPTRRDCMRCHSAQGINAPMSDHGGAMEMACAACHKPHAPPGQALLPCTRCHTEMRKGGLHARPGHARCLDCHKPHTWTVEAPSCLRCHPGAQGHAARKGCAGCHAFGGAPLPPRAQGLDYP